MVAILNTTAPIAVHETRLASLEKVHRGKVRDVYAIDAQRLLIVATDRLSAFDVILPDPIPGKGRILNTISNFWFAATAHIIPNHLLDQWPAQVVADAAERAQVEGRSVVARRLRALPIEAVVRGYLIGSGWKDYQASGKVCGIALPPGLRQAEQLPQVIFTPASKAAVGDHDENISFEEASRRIGADLAARVRDASIALYRFASEHAARRGILIADTKFEFGLAPDGQLLLMDEALTPDSSRFWPADTWRIGTSPPSFDKQYVRDYLETLDWNKQAPGPRLPPAVIMQTVARYEEALRRLTGPATAPA
jgi:phosphoribosylaminoimidazole-succinocarboxamide synthase